MNTSKTFALALALGVIPVVAIADQPFLDVDPARHGNLAAAQQLSRQAFDKLSAAQQANPSDLGGHAQKAKNLLIQVNQEIALAAQAADQH